MQRNDPLSKTYYGSLKNAEFWVDFAFMVAAILSICALLVDRTEYPILYDFVQGSFALTVITMFFGGMAVKLYWSNRAHEKRIADFISHSFDVSLIFETSSGYYNNREIASEKKLAASLLENTFFTKEISRLMLKRERLKIAFYSLVWVIALLYRATDLALIATAAQVVFSEQLISKWIRLEWLRIRVEKIYESLYILIQSTSDFSSSKFHARTLEFFVLYETGKSQAGVSLSSRIFRRQNKSLSNDWNLIKQKISIT